MFWKTLLFPPDKSGKISVLNKNTEVINYLPSFLYDKSFCIQNYIWFKHNRERRLGKFPVEPLKLLLLILQLFLGMLKRFQLFHHTPLSLSFSEDKVFSRLPGFFRCLNKTSFTCVLKTFCCECKELCKFINNFGTSSSAREIFFEKQFYAWLFGKLSHTNFASFYSFRLFWIKLNFSSPL